MRILAPILLALSLAASAAAQCSLVVHGTGAPGTTLTFAFQGDPNTLAGLVVGPHLGTTIVHVGSHAVLELGLAQPFVVAPLGVTDAHGRASLAVLVPHHLPAMTLFAQGLDVVVMHAPHPGIRFCTTHVVPFHAGS